MHKLFILTICILSGFCLKAQVNLDSLYYVWQDKTQTDSIRAKAYYDYIYDGILFNDPDSAFELAGELLEFAKTKQYPLVKAQAYNILGVSSWFMSNYPQAVSYFEISLKISEDIGNKKGIAGSLYNIGEIYVIIGNYTQALNYHERSLKIEQEIGNQRGIAQSLGSIAVIYSEQENYPKALEFHERSLKINKEIGDKKGIAMSNHDMGYNYMKQGNYSKALGNFQLSLEIFEEIEDKNNIANTLENIGIIYIEQSKFNLAIEICQRGYSLSEEIKSINLQRGACDCLYKAYKALGKGNQALKFHEQMLDLIDSLHSEETAKKLQHMEFSKERLADSLAQVEKSLREEIAYQQQINKEKNRRNTFMYGGIGMLILAGGLWSRLRYIRKSKAVLQVEKDRSENLLLNILPFEVAQELKTNGKAQARDFELVSIIFTDFKEFTETSEKLSATELVAEINHCFEGFDGILEKYGVEKIKTIGDAYMAAGGLPISYPDSTKNTVFAALEMVDFMINRKKEREADGKIGFEMRCGVHTGPVVAGIVGVKKFQYDIWGDTVNTASRMESSGEVGRVNISADTYELIKDEPDLNFTKRKKIEVKGKGEMEMYFCYRK